MMEKFTEGIERVYSDLDESPDARQDQQIFDILSDMEPNIETGEFPQEEIVDSITDAIGGEGASTELGARVESAVEKFYFQLGLDSISPDRRSRDYLAQSPTEIAGSMVRGAGTGIDYTLRGVGYVAHYAGKAIGQAAQWAGDKLDKRRDRRRTLRSSRKVSRTEAAVPDKVEGQPWVHSDDDFLFFLNWLVKREWSPQQIVDVVEGPHHYTKQYKQFLDQRDREAVDPLL